MPRAAQLPRSLTSSARGEAFTPAAHKVVAFFNLPFFQWLGVDTSNWAQGVLDKGEIKPEHLINLNALGIIFGQVLISYLARNLKPFTTIVSGVGITMFSFLVYLAGLIGSGFLLLPEDTSAGATPRAEKPSSAASSCSRARAAGRKRGGVVLTAPA